MNSAHVWAGMALVVAVATGCAASAESADEATTSASEGALNPDCAMVKCALPLCASGQHLSYQGSCCPTCVGPEPRCAAVMCPMLMCAIGEQMVTPKGQCCPKCIPAPPVAECTTDPDCPVYECIKCPCPVSKCVGRTCQTSTPDASTCGGTSTL